MGLGAHRVLVHGLSAIQEGEGTCFCPHRVKMVPLVTKEMMASPGMQ